MRHEEKGFRQAIIENPDDAGLRLVYGDWLEDQGDPRAEFIRVQVQLSALSEDDPSRPELQLRERALLLQHRKQWTRHLLGKCVTRNCRFRRGLIEGISVSSQNLLKYGSEIFEVDPIRSVQLAPIRPEDWSALAASPFLERLNEIDFSKNAHWRHGYPNGPSALTEEHLERFLDSDHLHGIRRMNLSDQLNDPPTIYSVQFIVPARLEMIAAAPALSGMTDINLGSNGLYGALHIIRRSRWELRSLDLSGCRIGDRDLNALQGSQCAHLTYLDLSYNHLTDEGGESLLQSPFLPQLETLYMLGNNFSSDMRRRLYGAIVQK